MPNGANFVDLHVYLGGAGALDQPGTLYDYVYSEQTPDFPLPFTYPPFAAVLFYPLQLLPFGVVALAWEVGIFAALYGVVRISQRLGRSGAPTAGRVLLLLARALDVAGANDAPVPSSTRAAHYVGAFSVSATTATQYLPLSGLVAYDLPRAAEYYVCNSTNQTVSSGWQLTVTPRAIVPTP